MKKILAIITFAILALATVSATDTLTITAKVKQVAPVFILKGGLTSGSYDKTATAAGTAIATDKDISEEDITVYVQLLQSNKSKYKSTVTVDIEGTALTSGTDSSSAPKAEITSTAAEVANYYSVSGSASGAKASFEIDYKKGKPVAANTEIGTASFTWEKDEDLPASDTYSATITMTYSAN